jgi:hypothetical protein
MKQRRFTSSDFVPEGETGDEDAVLDANDPIHEMKALAGLQTPNWKTYEGSNISNTANEKAQLMRENNIKPGTDEWFKLWFSRPYLTGEPPV